ncbi:SAM-dependent methyltransferase [Methanocorpusculum sp. MG]|uniref:SAM-dependent methyltransferase n=1 Tax=Methanocorpusculum petauri TaxID=3002863 RepID=A0ABT4ID34_9EURY|nr:SAM-dependent methyltransferase [Methanocorpusculum petauri]MCZ0859660.1 SAM-dependent methyltransferase [Methanocorpusculum petauri]
MKVRRIPKNQLQECISESWVDPARRPYCRNGYAYIPVRTGFPYDLDLPERQPYTGPGYQRLGDTLLLHSTAPTDDQLQNLIDWEHPSCILLLNHHDGVMRLPDVTVLYGVPHDVTFRETGITYTLNPTKVMFSQGNRLEKQRIRNLIRPGEQIADMFAGIGYFTLSAALAGAHVHAMEINPDSCAYLRKNSEINGVADKIAIVCGDCRTHLTGTYNRILMGHFDSPDFLTAALAHAEPGTVLHVHGIGDRTRDIEDTLQGAGFRYSLSEHKVKKYASRTWHCVWDIELR